MKNRLTFLLLIFVISNCFAQNAEKLPEIPWKAIVEMTRSSHFTGWKQDINIKLFGNHSTADSIMIQNSIAKLNSLIETVHLSFAKQDRGNLEIYFLDSSNNLDYRNIITLTKDQKSQWTYSTLQSNSILFSQAVNMDSIPIESRLNFLTNTIAFALYPVYWSDSEYFEKKNRNEYVEESIYRSNSIVDREKLYFEEMQEFDIKLLNEVYSRNFGKKLALANKKFKPFLLCPMWVRVNPHSFLLLPFGLLILFLFPLFMKISRVIEKKISNKVLRFNISGIIGLLIIAVIGSFYFSFSYELKYNFHNYGQFIKNFTAGTFISIIFALPAINILRLVEILIHKNTHKKVLKIVLIFLSTGLIPFLAIMGVYLYFLNRERPLGLQNAEIKLLSYIFIFCLVLAGFRALISYFFFKEKDLILENETKLSRLRELKTKAELNVLHSRINPHFLYNSLNSIAGLAHTDANKTEHMALSLSKLFRYSINKEKSDWTTLKEELEMVRIYLDVEKVRFDDRLTYSLIIPKELEETKIPRFIIQPLVENAVKHGISKSVKPGQIAVLVVKEGSGIIIAVQDSGADFPEDLIPGFGIQSIYDKLEILHKNKFEMSFVNTPRKQVSLKLK